MKRQIRQRTSRGLNWKNKTNKLKSWCPFQINAQPSNKHSSAKNLLNVSSYSNCLYHSCIVVGKDDADEVKNMILKALVMRYTSFMLTMAKSPQLEPKVNRTGGKRTQKEMEIRKVRNKMMALT